MLRKSTALKNTCVHVHKAIETALRGMWVVDIDPNNVQLTGTVLSIDFLL